MRTKFFIFIIALMLGAETIYAQSGTCGDNLSWNLEDHVLTISGVGDMTNYNNTDNWAPWESYIIDTVLINEGVTSIGEYAFYREYLMGVTIPNSVTTIGAYAFCGCGGITSITLPNSVTSVGENAFSASGIREIYYTGNLTEWCTKEWSPFDVIGAYDEYDLYIGGSKVTDVIIPNSVTNISDNAFLFCSSITSVIIPNTVTSIGEYAFSHCDSLVTIHIPNSVTDIGEFAFFHCSNLASINIPNCITSIKESVFRGCRSLQVVDLPNSLTRIEKYAFSGCLGLTSISIPENVTSIGEAAFFESGLKTVKIPNGVTRIEPMTFWNSHLTTIDMPNSITSIGSMAFAGCDITSITIPNSVTTIDAWAFNQCMSLEKVIVGSGVTTIIEGAFSYCWNLKTVTCYAINPPNIVCEEMSIFEDVDCSKIPLYVPAESVVAYKTADTWKDFNPILPIEAAIDEKVVPGQNQKQLKDGQILILRGDKTYTTDGRLVH